MLHMNTPWTIDYYSEDVRLEIAAMPVGIRAAYVRLTEMLEEFGLDLRMPHSRAMGGGLYELRPRGKEGIARVFYCTMVGRRIIVLTPLSGRHRKHPSVSWTWRGNDKERYADYEHQISNQITSADGS
jgi:phage-related protein